MSGDNYLLRENSRALAVLLHLIISPDMHMVMVRDMHMVIAHGYSTVLPT